MARLKKTVFVNAGDRIRALPQDRRERIETLADDMAMELHLSEIRKALSITQKDLAEMPDGTTAEIPMKKGKPVKSRVSAA